MRLRLPWVLTATTIALLATSASSQVSTLSNPSTNAAAVVSAVNGQPITPSSVAASGTVTGSNLSGTHSGASSGTNTGDQTTVSGQAGSVANAVTFDNSGSGAASGTTFNGGTARTVSTNTIGALKTSNNLSDVASLNTTVRNLQACYVVDQSAVATSALTGTLSETTMATITLPIMGANDELQIETLWSHTGTAGTWTPKVKLGTTVVEGNIANGATTASANYYQLSANRNATNSQVFYTPLNIANQGSSTAAVSTGAEETNAGPTLTLTGTLANTGDSMKLERRRIILCPKA